MKRLAVLSLAAVSTASFAQFSFNGPGGTILSPATGTANGTPGPLTTSTAVASGLPGTITEVWVSFTGANDLSHTWAGDMTLSLTSPGGTVLSLMNRPGRGTGSTFGFNTDFVVANDYTFRDSGTDVFATNPGATLASGIYRSSTQNNAPTALDAGLVAYSYIQTSFSVFNGQNGNGN